MTDPALRITAPKPSAPRGGEEITIGKLIGLGVQDLAAAEIAIRRLETAATTTTAQQPASANDLRKTST